VGLVVVKLGGSLITDKNKPFFFRSGVVSRLARELAEAYREKDLIILHGGGSYGHPVARRYRVSEGLQRSSLRGLAETRYWMTILNAKVTRALVDAGIPAVPMQTSAFTICERGAVKRIFLEPLKALLSMRAVPLAYGDVVMDTALGFSILSADVLAAELAIRLGAERLVYALAVDGVYTANPDAVSTARLLTELSADAVESVASGGTGIDVTGGMRLKLRCAARAAREGIEVVLGTGLKEGNLAKMVISGKGVRTRIVP